MKKTSTRECEQRFQKTLSTSPRLVVEPVGIGTFPAVAGGCRGFIGPVPPPLWMRTAMWRGSIASAPGDATDNAGRLVFGANLMSDDPRSPNAEPAQAPLWSIGACARRRRLASRRA